MRGIAPSELGKKLVPGPGFDLREQDGFIEWTQISVVDTGSGAWDFAHESPGGLRAVCSVALAPAHRVASDADWEAAQFADGSADGIVFVFRHAGPLTTQRLFVRGVESDKRYVFRDEATGAERSISGEELLTEGLRVEREPNSAKLFSYQAV